MKANEQGCQIRIHRVASVDVPSITWLLCVMFAFAPAARGVTVWVDFTSDFHNGANGPSNGIADWIDELNDATGAAPGVADFTAAERAIIEANIIAELETIYAGYELEFVTTEPSGEHDVIYMARDNDHPDVSSTNRGSAPVDIGNQDTNTYTDRDGNPSGVPKVTTGNFEDDLEAFDSRERQITEISTTLAGTAAHEYGHTLGLLHHYVYSHPDISPANYSNTGGIQNVYILATGNTGLSESEREVTRSLSPFSQVMLDVSGGSDASFFEENNSIVAGGIVSDRSEDNGLDAGSTILDAYPLAFETGPTSGQEISFIEADLDGSSMDVDMFEFSIPVEATLLAHVFSERLDLGSAEFDPVLELVDASGNTLLSVDDIGWDDDVYNDLVSPEDDDEDPFLLNLPLDPGTYFLRVLPATTDVTDTPNPGDNYWLITALQLAEPMFDPADFDTDGDIDGNDYLVWQRDPSVGSLSDWRENYGTPAPLAESTAAVPAPATCLQAMIGCAALLLCRNRTVL